MNSTCSSKSSFNDGRYSKFGDADTLLSSSTGKLNDSSFAWGVNFRSGNIHDLIYDDISYNVRCVRNDGSPLSACTEAGGTWNEDEGVCKVKCSDKPDNTEWNGTSFYTRTYDDGTLSGKAVTEYNDKTEGACHFKCEEDYVWIDNQCKPECNKNTTSFPCIDLSTGYIWSDKEKSIQGFRDAKNYCDQLNKQNYGNFSSSGWHLPTIEELKTLVISDRVSTKCKLSEAKKCLSFKNCWSCSTCTAAGNQSTSSNDCDYWGVYYNDGRYSKFGDSGTFWSSSIPDEFKSDVWDVTFGSGSVGRSSNATFLKVRCVRNSK